MEEKEERERLGIQEPRSDEEDEDTGNPFKPVNVEELERKVGVAQCGIEAGRWDIRSTSVTSLTVNYQLRLVFYYPLLSQKGILCNLAYCKTNYIYSTF